MAGLILFAAALLFTLCLAGLFSKPLEGKMTFFALCVVILGSIVPELLPFSHTVTLWEGIQIMAAGAVIAFLIVAAPFFLGRMRERRCRK